MSDSPTEAPLTSDPTVHPDDATGASDTREAPRDEDVNEDAGLPEPPD
jgi:hypothetical protein